MPRTDAESIILELLRDAGGDWTGKTRLFKAFYFAHLFYTDNSPALLTDWPIARMPEGPGIDRSHILFEKLVKEGCMVVSQTRQGPYPEYRYQLTEKGKLGHVPPDDVRAAVKQAYEFCKDRTAAQLSQETHEFSRSWKEGKDGDILDIYIDLVPEDEGRKREAEISQLNIQLETILQD